MHADSQESTATASQFSHRISDGTAYLAAMIASIKATMFASLTCPGRRQLFSHIAFQPKASQTVVVDDTGSANMAE
jgi:hypothetical protein